MINLDTHILIYALSDELKSKEKRLLERNPWSISAIVLWELVKLVQLGRVDIDLNNRVFVHALNRIRVWPITFEIARASTQLDIQSDPADEIICATSVVHNVPLITRDALIRKSKMVPIA